MNLRNLLSLTCLAGLAACTNASASTMNPSEDVDCSVVVFYFNGLAEHLGRPAEERHATKVINEWYAGKVREIAAARPDGTSAVYAEAAPVLEAVKADPQAARDELMACTERAVDDPSFDAFAKSFAPTA